MADNVADFSAILKVLARHEVEFIVVDGVCAVLLGAPVSNVHDYFVGPGKFLPQSLGTCVVPGFPRIRTRQRRAI